MKRRLAVLRKRWERLFDRKVKEIDNRRAEVSAELAALTQRHQQLHSVLANVIEREGASNTSAAATDLQAATSGKMPARTASAVIPELEALRAELERVAVFMLDMELPEPLTSSEQDLPWGMEEAPETPASVFQFESSARAA
jgi:ABC-type phosphate transport system auxiliary subunit